MYRHFTKGSWTFSDQDQGWVVSDCTAEALKVDLATSVCTHYCNRTVTLEAILTNNFYLQCLLVCSQMPKDLAGEKADVERLYDAVNVLLYLQV
jgi:hypothetical protein